MEYLAACIIIGVIAVAAMWHFASKSPVMQDEDHE